MKLQQQSVFAIRWPRMSRGLFVLPVHMLFIDFASASQLSAKIIQTRYGGQWLCLISALEDLRTTKTVKKCNLSDFFKRKLGEITHYRRKTGFEWSWMQYQKKVKSDNKLRKKAKETSVLFSMEGNKPQGRCVWENQTSWRWEPLGVFQRKQYRREGRRNGHGSVFNCWMWGWEMGNCFLSRLGSQIERQDILANEWFVCKWRDSC